MHGWIFVWISLIEDLFSLGLFSRYYITCFGREYIFPTKVVNNFEGSYLREWDECYYSSWKHWSHFLVVIRAAINVFSYKGYSYYVCLWWFHTHPNTYLRICLHMCVCVCFNYIFQELPIIEKSFEGKIFYYNKLLRIFKLKTFRCHCFLIKNCIQ